MHSLIQERLEDLLSGATPAGRGEDVSRHLETCTECRDEIAMLRGHAQLLRALRVQEEMEVRAGFYSRVLHHIEAQRPSGGWMSLLQSPFALRIALASVALTLLIGTVLFTNEDQGPEMAQTELQMIHEDQMPIIESGQARDPDSVLVSLASYQEQ